MKRFAVLLATILGGLAAAFVMLAPAAAASPTPAADPAAAAASGLQITVHAPGYSCQDNEFCLYENSNYKGRVLVAKGHGSQCYFGAYNFHDIASSQRNRTDQYVTLFADVHCHGTTYKAHPNTVDPTFVGNDFNDRADGILIP